MKVAIDTETTGLHVWRGDRPFAVSMCFDDGETAYWEWPVDPFTRRPIVNRRERNKIKYICSREDADYCFFNAKFDLRMLKMIGVEVAGRVHEVQFKLKALGLSYKQYALKPLAKSMLDYPDDDEGELKKMTIRARRIAKKRGWSQADAVEADYWMNRTIAEIEPEAWDARLEAARGVCETYAVRDAERTMLLNMAVDPKLDELGVRDVYETEMKLLRVTMDMEDRGVRIDPKEMGIVKDQCVKTMARSERRLKKAAGEKFCVSSSDDLRKLLYHQLKLPVLKRTKKHKMPSADAETLMKLKERTDHPLLSDILRWRSNQRAVSTFFDAYKKYAIVEDGDLILHADFRQWGTTTGRYSAANPNLQQVSNSETTNSKAAEFVVNVRPMFIPRKDHVWYLPDYSQVEVIIFAEETDEPAMVQAIRDGLNVHDATTEKVWGGEDNDRGIKSICRTSGVGKDEAEALMKDHGGSIMKVDEAMGHSIHRKLAKSVTFTKIFGGGPAALQGWINVDIHTAASILHDYDVAFPAMMRSMNRITRQAKRDGFVVNRYGRRIAVDRWAAYTAVNYVCQSGAADLMKRGMIKCYDFIRSNQIEATLIMSIHDELVFEFRRGADDPKVIAHLVKLMSDSDGRFNLPTPVEVKFTDTRWSETRKLEVG